jgi:hypothetical protein
MSVCTGEHPGLWRHRTVHMEEIECEAQLSPAAKEGLGI